LDTSKLEVGQSARIDVKVTTEMTTNRTGNTGDDVLSTPAMLGLMEGACISQSDHLLDKNASTVGYAVDGLRHVARTDVGETVQISTSLTELDGAKGRLTYEIEVTHNGNTVGKAIHKRAIISR
jgi:predicted thioesterase|tara:strand:- start:305 stop:676 length:372 start_codon:yes stop_codon:yes gene_type:complete